MTDRKSNDVDSAHSVTRLESDNAFIPAARKGKSGANWFNGFSLFVFITWLLAALHAAGCMGSN